MTEEIKNEKTECKCFVGCECFKKFLIVTFGSFIGVFFALSLFAALHRPPCAGPCPLGPKMQPPIEHQQKFDHKMFKHGHHHPPMPPMEKPVKR